MSDSRLNLVIQFLPIDKLSGALKNIVGLGRSGDQALKGMKREARDLGTQLREARLATAGASGNVTKLIDRERELEAALAGVNRQIERQQRLNAIDARVSRMQARAGQLKSAGQSNMLGGAAMFAPFVLAGKQAMDFSSGMVDIQQKAELTNAETAQMARNLMAAARSAHQLPEAMRGGVDVLAGMGLDPRQAVRMIDPIGRLGTAFKVDLSDGAAAAYANLNALKVPILETGRAFDIMAAGGNAGAFEVKDMARWFPALTAQMQALGQKGTPAVADLTAALQIARRGAADADAAGNNIQNLLTKINAPATIRAFKKNFGIDLPAALQRAYAQGKTPLEAIAELTKKATGGDLSKLGFAFEDMQAQGALRALILNLDDYRKIRADISNSGGTVDKAFRQRELQDASVQWQTLKGRMQESAIVLGTKLLPAAGQFVNLLVPMIDGVSRFADAHPQLTGNLIALVAGLAGARIGFGALQFAFGTILGPAATVWGWFTKFKEVGSIAGAFPKAAKAFGVLRTAAGLLGQGMMRAGAALLANPIVLVVAGIALAAYLIYTHWDKIKAAFFKGKEMLGQAWTWIKGKIAQFPLAFGPLGLLVSFVAGHWDQIKGAFGAARDMLGQAWSWVEGKFTSGVAMVKGAIGALPDWLKNLGSNMMSGLLLMLSPSALADKLLAIARAGITAFKNFFGIKSPSRLFMAMGGHLNAGLALGIDRSRDGPLRAVRAMAAGVAGAGAMAFAQPSFSAPDLPRPEAQPSFSAPDLPRPEALRLIAPDLPRPEALRRAAPGFAPGPALAPALPRLEPLAPARRTGRGQARPSIGKIEIHIHQQPGEDAEDLARKVLATLERKFGGGGTGGGFEDDF